VLSLVDLSVVRVAVDLPAADAVHVRAGDPVTVTFPALPGETWAGRVAFIAARAGEGTLQFPAEIELAGEERLAAGMLAQVALELGRAGTGLAVPLDALDRGPDGSFVWRLDHGVVSRVPVVVASARGGRAILTAGVEAGDRVALAPHAGLSDGLAVGEVSVAPLPDAR
jgi:RND family efflux transporter MFP subunit